jgi:prepilin-type N-terminal cleavage/methylation domain-containing protein
MKIFSREPGGERRGPKSTGARRAFSLLEVMIAIAILCMGTFAILDLISSSLANARRLQRPLVDGSAVIAEDVATNKLIEGIYEGNMGDLLGKNYNDFKWTKEIREVQSNKLFQVDVIIQHYGSRDAVARTTTLLYKPDSPPGSMDGGGGLIH